MIRPFASSTANPARRGWHAEHISTASTNWRSIRAPVFLRRLVKIFQSFFGTWRKDAIFLVGGDPIVKGHVAFATEKGRLAIGETEAYEDLGNSVFVIDLDTGKSVFRQSLRNAKEVAGLLISADGSIVIVAVVCRVLPRGPNCSVGISRAMYLKLAYRTTTQLVWQGTSFPVARLCGARH